MPVAKSQGHAGKALLVAAVGVLVALGVAFLVARMAAEGDVDVRLGDETFQDIQVDSLAPRIERDGGLPVLYQDLTGGSRHIFVQHVGEEPDEGWLAFSAFDPDDPDCLVEIDREARTLVNACTGETYPLNGEGLRYYETRVEDGHLIVDLNSPAT